MSNTVEKKDNVIIKSYGSRMDFARESSVYNRLRGSDLSPELISQYDGRLEHIYVEGPTFLERYSALLGRPEELAGLFEAFFTWYVKYRELTNLILGKMNLEKFIVSKSGLKYVDFEHCRPGYFEQDLAKACVQLLMFKGSYEHSCVSAAKLFLCVGSSFIKWRPDNLIKYLKEYLGENTYSARSFINSSGCCGLILAGGKVSGQAALMASCMPQRLVHAVNGASVSCGGYRNIETEKKGRDAFKEVFSAVTQPLVLLVDGNEPGEEKYAEAMLRFLEPDFDGAVMLAGGALMKSPVLVKTSAALSALSESDPDISGDNLIRSLTEKLNIQILIAENIF